MKIAPENMKISIQAMLDQLNDEHVIPFKLTAHKIDDLGDGQYAIRFYDSRLHSIILSSTQGASVKEKIRDAVVDVFAPVNINVVEPDPSTERWRDTRHQTIPIPSRPRLPEHLRT